MKHSFGYSISKSRETDWDKLDHRFADRLLDLDPSVRLCVGCGSCTGACQAVSRSGYNIRKTHTRFRRGETGAFLSEIEQCMFCGKCAMVCPRGVNIRNVIDLMKKLTEA
ncbi:MAG: 4Fe-4S dicluster domain-containing protein [Prolixibacteraceae bacterium]|jgi:heterodisulfide reductase subunit C|nr:4Fe-4S dicluster domain-containing protein [Prolixibacteraceae bacterium]